MALADGSGVLVGVLVGAGVLVAVGAGVLVAVGVSVGGAGVLVAISLPTVTETVSASGMAATVAPEYLIE